jgi:hypothetical protein
MPSGPSYKWLLVLFQDAYSRWDTAWQNAMRIAAIGNGYKSVGSHAVSPALILSVMMTLVAKRPNAVLNSLGWKGGAI